MKTHMDRRKTLWHFHFLCWIGYGVYFYQVNRLDNDTITWREVAVYLPAFAVIFYSVLGILRANFTNRFRAVGLVYLLGFYATFMLVAHPLVLHVLPWFGIDLMAGAIRDYSFGGFVQTLVVMLSNYSMFALAFFFIERSVRHARAKQAEAEAKLEAIQLQLQAEREKQRYEYLALAGQVSPHIMANLLDGWRQRLDPGQHHLATAMEGAYELMVYYMEARLPHKRRVPVTSEVAQVKTLIDLAEQEGKPIYIQWQCEARLAGYTLPPTTLLTPFENAMKHGHTDLPEHPVHMELAVHNNQLRFSCSNVVRDEPNSVSHGVGMANLRRRLELEYGERFRLESKLADGIYTIRLTIDY